MSGTATSTRATGTLEIERRDFGDVGSGGEFAFRVPTQLELRAKEGAAMPGLRGYTAVFNSWSLPLGIFEDFREKIAPGAFAKTIAESDIRALFDHETSKVLGRSKAGAGTLKLTEDSNGLEFDIEELPDSPNGREIVALVERQDVDGCSFGFRTVRDEWAYDRPDDAPDDADGELIEAWRTLVEVRLFDVGPVTYPAYPETTAEVRSHVAALRAAAEGRKHSPELGELYLKSYRQRLREIDARGARLHGDK